MNRINRCINILLAVTVLLISSGAFAGKGNTDRKQPRFAVISDVHFENNRGEGARVKVPAALKNIFSKELPDALFVVGDLTQDGEAEQYDMLLSVFKDKTLVPEAMKVYYLMGNHDHWTKNGNSEKLFKEKIKQPLNQFAVIRDYPFITLSMNARNANGYNRETGKFLAEKLEYSAKKFPGKPIFVFMHVPPLNTCYGSQEENGWGGDALNDILNRYPQVILFAGHSHMPVGDPRSIFQDKFTVVNDGSTAYTGALRGEVDGNIWPENDNVTEGLIVNVLENGNVELERWDTYRNEEIAPRWIIEAPHDGSQFNFKNRNGLPAPAFANNAKPSVKTVGADSCVVTFPQASDNDAVHHYLLEISDDTQILKSFRVHSQFYLNSRMPAQLSVGFAGLPQDTMLTVQIKAVDSYGNLSAPVSETFMLRSLPRFAVISDTHFENNIGEGAAVKVPRALKNLFSKRPLPDAIFVVGDITHRGKPEQYRQLLSVFNDKSNVPEGVDVYFMMGYQHDKSETGGPEVFLEIVKQPLHQAVEIKGYPFIYISEGGRRDTEHNRVARSFLSEKMAEAAQKYPAKPIFVFMHIPPKNTCYGSTESDGWGTDFFTPVLEKYPQAIVFSGHSHFPLSDPRSIHQERFTSINDGSTTFSEVEPGVLTVGIHPENNETVTEGIIVNILKTGDVEMERWDTYRNEEILPRWTVKAPHDGSNLIYKGQNGLPAPAFAAGAKPEVTTVGADSCVVTFPQAGDNEVVHHYVVEILNKNKVISSFSKFSQFYLNSEMPASLEVSFSKLPARKKLTVRVTAVDSFNNKSQPITAEFTVKQ